MKEWEINLYFLFSPKIIPKRAIFMLSPSVILRACSKEEQSCRIQLGFLTKLCFSEPLRRLKNSL